MKIDLKMLENSNIEYNWKTLYVGISSNIIELEELTNYAVNLMSQANYENNDFINELSWGIENKTKEEVLTEMRINCKLDNLIDESEEWEKEKQKLRYVLLKNIRCGIKDDKKILEEVEEVYEDFGYPEDMELFIAYMPVKDNYDPSQHSYEENNMRLIRLFDDFLKIEKENIK